MKKWIRKTMATVTMLAMVFTAVPVAPIYAAGDDERAGHAVHLLRRRGGP